MITVRVITGRPADTGLVSVSLVFDDRSGFGIRSISISDVAGAPVTVDQPPAGACPHVWVVNVAAAPSRLPLYAEAVDCSGQTTSREELGGPLAGAPPDPTAPLSLPCSAEACPVPSLACTEAISRLQSARDQMRTDCSRCNGLQDQADTLTREAEATGLAATVLSLLAAAAFALLPWPANLIIGLLLAAAAAIAWGFYIANFIEADRARGLAYDCWKSMAALFEAHRAAVRLVETDCCRCNRPNLDPPCDSGAWTRARPTVVT